MDTWKHRQTSAPRRDYAAPQREKSYGLPDWISRIPRILPDARKDESNRCMYSGQRRSTPPFEPQSYSEKSWQHEYYHRSRSPHFREHQPYLR